MSSLRRELFFPKKACTNLLEQPRDRVTEWLRTIDTVVTDCDGVLWTYGSVVSGAVDAIHRLQNMGKTVIFCTNNSTKTRAEIVEKARNRGFKISEDDIISTAYATASYLMRQKFTKKAYVIGSKGITREMEALNLQCSSVGLDALEGELDVYLEQLELDDDVGAVIVGFDEQFSFPKMIKATLYLRDPKCLFIATNTEKCFSLPDMVIPGTGSFVRAIQTSTHREPLVIGKPNGNICEEMISAGKINPKSTLMVGGRCNTDILLGQNCGFQTMLVGTGAHNISDVNAYKVSPDPEVKKLIPDSYLPSIGDLLLYL